MVIKQIYTVTLSIIFVFLSIFILFFSEPALAACTGGGLTIPKCDTNSSGAAVPLSENPILAWIGFFINILAVIIVAGSSLMIAVAGLQYITSRESAQGIQAAKQKIWNALIGLVAFFFLFGFVQWLIPGGIWSSSGEFITPAYNTSSETALDSDPASTINDSTVNSQEEATESNTTAVKSSWPTNEEFNTINTSIWRLYDRSNGAEKFGHTDPNALHLYSSDQIKAEDGAMVITATKKSNGQWDSGFASSKETKHFMPLYGKIEVRAQLPHEPGIWPAIWLRHRSGSSTAEVDTAEVFYKGGDSVSQSLHFPNTVGTHAFGKGVDLSNPNGWHTYWSDIQPAKNGAIKFTFGVDDKTTGSYTLSESNAQKVKAVDNNATWAVALNIAVTDNKWSGDADKASSPQVMKVDWVRWSK